MNLLTIPATPAPIDPRETLADAVQASGIALASTSSAHQVADALLLSRAFGVRIDYLGQATLIAQSGRDLVQEVRMKLLTQEMGHYLAPTPELASQVALAATARAQAREVQDGGNAVGLAPRRY